MIQYFAGDGTCIPSKGIHVPVYIDNRNFRLWSSETSVTYYLSILQKYTFYVQMYMYLRSLLVYTEVRKGRTQFWYCCRGVTDSIIFWFGGGPKTSTLACHGRLLLSNSSYMRAMCYLERTVRSRWPWRGDGSVRGQCCAWDHPRRRMRAAFLLLQVLVDL